MPDDLEVIAKIEKTIGRVEFWQLSPFILN